MFNADPKHELEFNLPQGSWNVLVDENNASSVPIAVVEKGVKLSPSTGMVLVKQ